MPRERSALTEKHAKQLMRRNHDRKTVKKAPRPDPARRRLPTGDLGA
jgi:hypothetical protein